MRLLLTTFGLLSACENLPKNNTDTADTGTIDDTDTNNFESGCFVIDGGEGYALLSDAITMASDGATITMDDCGALHEEVVTVNKSVTISGPGSNAFTLTPPTNENGFNITASNVTITGISINSTRSGVSLESASGVVLDDIVVRESGNWGLKAVASEATISNSEFSGNGFGGVNTDGSELSVSDSIISGNTSYGVYAISGSTLDIQNTAIQGNLSSGSEDTQDGIGIYVEDNTILMVNQSDIDTNDIFSTYAINSSVFLTEVNAGETQFGAVWSEGTGELSLIDVTISNAPIYGIIAQITGAVNIESTSIITESELSPSVPAETWRDEGLQSTGLFTNSPSISVTGLDISGYNNCGAYFTTNELDAQLDIDGLNITEVGRLGTYVIGYDGAINDLNIDGIYELDGASDPEVNSVCSFVDRYVGAVIVDNIDLTNVSLSNVEGYGLTGIQSNLVIDGLEAENNTCASVIAFQSALFLSNAEFALPNAKQYNLGASLVAYDASTVSIDQTTFEGLPYAESQYDYQLYSYNTSDFQLSNSSLSNGYYGIFSEGSQLTITDTSFTNLSSMATYFSQSNSSNHVIERSTYTGGENSIGYSMYCYDGGQVEIIDSIFENMTSDAIYMNLCSSELDTVSFTDIGGAALNVYDGDHEWDKLDLENVGIDNFASGSVVLRALSGPTLLSLSSSSFTNVGYDGVYLYSYGTSSPITAYIDGVNVDTTVDDGIYTYGVEAQVTNTTFLNTGGEGISASGNVVSLNNTTIDTAYSHGIGCNDSILSLTSVNINNTTSSGLNGSYCTVDASTVSSTNNGQHGFNLNYSPLTGTNLDIQNAGSSGINSLDGDISLTSSNIIGSSNYGVNLSGSSVNISLDQMTIDSSGLSAVNIENTSGTITGSTISNSQEYGLICVNSDATFCGNNILTANMLGEQTGCDLSCGVEANPVIEPPTDTGDTGSEEPPTDTADSGVE